MFCDERFELRDELGLTAEGEVGVDALLERREPQLFELCDGRGRERLGPQLGQRFVPPEPEGVVQQRSSMLKVGGRPRLRA